MKRWIFTLLLILAAASAAAEIFKWRLPDGSIEYSDRPPVEGAERVELSPLVTYTPPAASAPAASADPESAAEFDGYDSFAIASPADNATVRDNAGDITLNFTITPALVEGHAIDIFLDGRKFGRSTAAVVTLSNVRRGAHQIYATIVDDSGAELARAGAIKITLQRVSKILSDEEKPPGEETPFDDAITAIGGPKSPGGPRSPGGPASPAGPTNPGGVKSPGGPTPRFGATPTLPSPPPAPPPPTP